MRVPRERAGETKPRRGLRSQWRTGTAQKAQASSPDYWPPFGRLHGARAGVDEGGSRVELYKPCVCFRASGAQAGRRAGGRHPKRDARPRPRARARWALAPRRQQRGAAGEGERAGKGRLRGTKSGVSSSKKGAPPQLFVLRGGVGGPKQWGGFSHRCRYLCGGRDRAGRGKDKGRSKGRPRHPATARE